MVLEDEPGFGKVRSSVFPDLGLGSAHFWLNKFEVRAFWKGSKEFEVLFWWTNLGLSDFKIQPVKFQAVRSSLYLGLIYTWDANKEFFADKEIFARKILCKEKDAKKAKKNMP